jgi:hypothetical protein
LEKLIGCLAHGSTRPDRYKGSNGLKPIGP